MNLLNRKVASNFEDKLADIIVEFNRHQSIENQIDDNSKKFDTKIKIGATIGGIGALSMAGGIGLLNFDSETANAFVSISSGMVLVGGLYATFSKLFKHDSNFKIALDSNRHKNLENNFNLKLRQLFLSSNDNDLSKTDLPLIFAATEKIEEKDKVKEKIVLVKELNKTLKKFKI